MLAEDDWRVALDDARKRHESLTALILFTDSQAVALLRLYVTIGVAAGSAAIAGLAVTAVFPIAVSLALIGATVALLVGAVFCFYAMETVDISLPGRDAEFWLWAAREDIDRVDAFRAYLDNLVAKSKQNRDINAKTALALSRAKLFGVLAPAAALLAGGAGLVLAP